MKNKLSTTLFKIIPIAAITFLVACSSPEKESKAKITEQKVMDESIEKSSENNASINTYEDKVELADSVSTIETKATLNTLETDITKVEEVKPELIESNAKNVTNELDKKSNIKAATKASHSIWNELLQKNVSSKGKVNYKGLKTDKAKIETYLATLKSNVPNSEWSKNEKLAYWINVYNAFTVKLIVDNYPLKSITDLDKPWDKKWIEIDGKTYSLGNVENDILRKMGESRIHFVINCASVSCPNLLNEAFTADKLSSQLRRVTKDFFNDETKNNLIDGDLKVSKLFEWYAKDFSNGDIVAYINKYSGNSFSADSKVSFLEYSWKLNE